MIAELSKLELIYYGNMKRVKKFKSLKRQVIWRIVYFFRDFIEYVYGNLYFGQKIPLDPNVVGILKKKLIYIFLKMINNFFKSFFEFFVRKIIFPSILHFYPFFFNFELFLKFCSCK